MSFPAMGEEYMRAAEPLGLVAVGEQALPLLLLIG